MIVPFPLIKGLVGPGVAKMEIGDTSTISLQSALSMHSGGSSRSESVASVREEGKSTPPPSSEPVDKADGMTKSSSEGELRIPRVNKQVRHSPLADCSPIGYDDEKGMLEPVLRP